MKKRHNTEGLSEGQIQEVLASVPMSDRSYKEMAMQPADHQFIVRLLNVWHAATKEDLKGFMKELYLSDNKALVKSVVKEVKAVISPLQKEIQVLSHEVRDMKGMISCHDTRIQEMEKKVDRIEIDVERLKKDIEELKVA